MSNMIRICEITKQQLAENLKKEVLESAENHGIKRLKTEVFSDEEFEIFMKTKSASFEKHFQVVSKYVTLSQNPDNFA